MYSSICSTSPFDGWLIGKDISDLTCPKQNSWFPLPQTCSSFSPFPLAKQYLYPLVALVKNCGLALDSSSSPLYSIHEWIISPLPRAFLTMSTIYNPSPNHHQLSPGLFQESPEWSPCFFCLFNLFSFLAARVVLLSIRYIISLPLPKLFKDLSFHSG